jgi:hypothetical protein
LKTLKLFLNDGALGEKVNIVIDKNAPRISHNKTEVTTVKIIILERSLVPVVQVVNIYILPSPYYYYYYYYY